MADGVYERRGPREAELARLRRRLEELRLARAGGASGEAAERTRKGEDGR